MRDVTMEPGFSPYAEGSCLIRCGNTHVLCTATVEEKVPPFLRGQGQGWVTAEYGMLPRSTHTRTDREAARGKQSGRTQEIQRLIGRSLRAVTDLTALGERQVKIDCDVLQADGGTRTASITGSWVALRLAIEKLLLDGRLTKMPLTSQVAAISCGIYDGTPVLDLDYAEDSSAETDANFVLTSDGGVVEVQMTAEEDPFDRRAMNEMFDLAERVLPNLARCSAMLSAGDVMPRQLLEDSLIVASHNQGKRAGDRRVAHPMGTRGFFCCRFGACRA